MSDRDAVIIDAIRTPIGRKKEHLDGPDAITRQLRPAKAGGEKPIESEQKWKTLMGCVTQIG